MDIREMEAELAAKTAKFTNRLFYGDNLTVMREHIAAESVDLVYLDPPFNSNATYNVLFAEKSGDKSASQIKAFEDTWEYTIETEGFLMELLEQGGSLAELMKALKAFLGRSDMMAYLVMMAIRLVEIRRIMKDTATIWLHCDPKASHYLKLILDSIFGPKNFRNEVIWQRTIAKSLMKRQLPNNHDVILSYQKTAQAKWVLGEPHQLPTPATSSLKLSGIDRYVQVHQPRSNVLFLPKTYLTHLSLHIRRSCLTPGTETPALGYRQSEVK